MPVLALGDRRVPVTISTKAGRITYRLRIDVPATDLQVPVRIELLTRSRPWRPSVFATAPECLRHRYRDGSLCMWWNGHSNTRRWILSDGLAALVHYVEIHLYQEACCRAGEPWPGEAAPGRHDRKTACATCGGNGP
jgi:hypothetical protein